MIFKDRSNAGKLLEEKLAKYQKENVVVLALPRGGVIVANEIALYLKAPLDLIITRKIGHPLNPEYAIGAVGESGNAILNENETQNIDKNWLKGEIQKQKNEAIRRRKVYLNNKQPISLKNKIAIISDDGIATGYTMLAAISDVKKQKPQKIIVAAPVAPKDTIDKISNLVNEIVVLEIPQYFAGAVGAYFENFDTIDDGKVKEILSSYNT